MSTIKISQLPAMTVESSNTSNTILLAVDLVNGVTGSIPATSLAAGLYSNNPLAVGNNNIQLPNTIAQFSGLGESYVQTNLINLNDDGSADIVVTANTGTDSTYFIDVGYANKNYQPGQEFNNIGTAINALDGYIYAQGINSSVPGGNLIVGSTTSGREVRFIAGGGSSSDVIAKMTANGLYMMNGKPFYFADGTVLSSSNTNTLAAAFNTANNATANNIYQNSINATQNTNIQSAWNLANTAVQNTSTITITNLNAVGNITAAGIQSTTGAIATGNLIVNGTANMTGSLNVTGIVNMNAQVVLTNSSFSNTQSALTITATPTVSTPSQDGYMIHISGKQNVSSRIVTDSYGANTYVVYAGRSARGNVSNPTAVQTGDILTRFSGNGYGTTGYAPLGSGRLDIVAVENFTDTARGTQLQIWNTPVGTNTLTNIATFNGVDVVFTGEVNPQKGLVLTPNVLSGITTTLNIDIANNSLYVFKTNATTTINLSGFKQGKIVEVWLTNTDTGGGSNHTITHGCLANNSTVGATSFTLSSLHSAYIKYFSIDGDQANTYCQVSYS